MASRSDPKARWHRLIWDCALILAPTAGCGGFKVARTDADVSDVPIAEAPPADSIADSPDAADAGPDLPNADAVTPTDARPLVDLDGPSDVEIVEDTLDAAVDAPAEASIDVLHPDTPSPDSSATDALQTDTATRDAAPDALIDATTDASDAPLSDASPSDTTDAPRCDVACDGACVDPRSDPSNCGACGVACGTEETCSFGTCLLICPTAHLACGGTCVNTGGDSMNCGGCGRACSSGQICSGGSCVTADDNLVLNHGFESPDIVYPPTESFGDRLWETFFEPLLTDYGRCDIVTRDTPEGGAHLRCEVHPTPGMMPYQFAVHQSGLDVVNGVEYDLRFLARADAPRPLTVTLAEPAGGTPRLRLGNRTVTLLTRWTLYDLRITTENIPDAGASPSKLSFFLQSATAGVVELDDVRLQRIR